MQATRGETMAEIERAKKNFKTNVSEWQAGLSKAEEMRRLGYDVDMTLVLNHAVRQFGTESVADTVARLELEAGDPIAHPWRSPMARPTAAR